MIESTLARTIAACVVVCVLGLFFFPLAHGSFQATHGPTTSLEAGRALTALLFSILIAAFTLFLLYADTASQGLRTLYLGSPEQGRQLRGAGTVLRC